MKRQSKLFIYRYLFSKIRLVNCIPKFSYSKNVQGWFFTRDYTIYWFKWALIYMVKITSDLNMNRTEAHKMNVKKYMHKKNETDVYSNNKK